MTTRTLTLTSTERLWILRVVDLMPLGETRAQARARDSMALKIQGDWEWGDAMTAAPNDDIITVELLDPSETDQLESVSDQGITQIRGTGDGIPTGKIGRVFLGILDKLEAKPAE